MASKIKPKSKAKKDDLKPKILKQYADLASELGHAPRMEDLVEAGLSKDSVKHHFSSLGNLDEKARELYPQSFFDADIGDLYNDKALKRLRKEVKRHKRFVITTAVTGCEVDLPFYNSIKQYCTNNDALMLVMVSSDPAHTKSKGGYGTIDKALQNEVLVLEDTDLNSNIFISTIKLSAKHIDPTTGLDRIGQRAGSFVFASPKQRLNLVATSNIKLPHSLMTTGAITMPNYNTDMYMSERTAYIANADHVMGALIVEIEDKDRYHYRQIQANADGSFVDLGVRYSPDTVAAECPEALVLGDWHSGATDPQVRQATEEMLVELKPRVVVLHDAFDGLSINHHEEHNALSKAQRFINGAPSLEQEIQQLTADLDWFAQFVDEIVVVKSNHDEFLSKHYLQKAKYADDPQNHFYALDLAKAMLQGKDPLQFAVEAAGLKNKHKIKWLKRDDDYKIAGIELGAHGDKGPNGSKGSLRNMQKAYGKSVTGHSHTPGILHGSFAVGTSSLLKLNYNEGPSSWLQTHCPVYKDGGRQLLNMIDGKWKL